MEWQAARRILILAFLLFDLLLLALRFGPGRALVPSLSGPVDLSSLILTDGLDLNARPLHTTAAIPVLKVSTVPPEVILVELYGFLPAEVREGKGYAVYRLGDGLARTFTDGSVEVVYRVGTTRSRASLTPGEAERLARGILAHWPLGVHLGPPFARIRSDGEAVVAFPEMVMPGGYPLGGAGVSLTFTRGGSLAEARLRLVQVIGRRRPDSPLIPGAAAIVTWAETRPAGHPLVVTSVRLGYMLPPGAHGLAFELDPTWLVTETSGRTVGIDALTEEVIP